MITVDRLGVSLRGRGIYGETGTGAEVTLLVSGRDFI